MIIKEYTKDHWVWNKGHIGPWSATAVHWGNIMIFVFNVTDLLFSWSCDLRLTCISNGFVSWNRIYMIINVLYLQNSLNIWRSMETIFDRSKLADFLFLINFFFFFWLQKRRPINNCNKTIFTQNTLRIYIKPGSLNYVRKHGVDKYIYTIYTICAHFIGHL